MIHEITLNKWLGIEFGKGGRDPIMPNRRIESPFAEKSLVYQFNFTPFRSLNMDFKHLKLSKCT